MFPRISVPFLAFLLSFVPLAASAGALTYPGPAPCDTTLQACIDGANSGDIIEIATNDRIDEALTIAKSLTLRPAAGFTPLIGNPDPILSNTIRVQDAGLGGGIVEVFFAELTFDAARIRVEFDQDSGHRFEMTDSSLTHDADSNNDVGVDLGLVRTSSTIVLTNNFIAAPGQPVSHFTGGAGGDIEITLQGNLLTGTDPANSHIGVQLIVGGSENLVMNLIDNVVYRVASCNCGGNSGLFVLTRDTAAVTLNVTNNTFDDFATGQAIVVRDTEGSSTLDFNLFNNTVSNADGEGFVVIGASPGLTLDNGFNNFFNTQPNSGIVEGEGTIFVDPLFIDPAGANYRLQALSPLIDAGTLTPPAGLPAVDADGLPRIVGDSVDIGAYEAGTDLELVKTVSAATADVGDELTYTLTVINLGPDDTAEVEVVDALPAGLLLQSASASQGSCSGTTELLCELGALANGDSATVTLTVLAQQAGTVTNTATVTSGIPDTDPANDSSSATTEVSAAGQAIISGGGCQLNGGGQASLQGAWLLLGLGWLGLGIGRKLFFDESRI